MGFRQLYIKKANAIKYKQNNLIIEREDEEDIMLPLDDISNIFVEDNSCVVTVRLITELSSRGIGLILCNESYLPTAQVLSLNMHYNQTGILELQLGTNQKFKDNIWKNIVKQKILNQKFVLDFCIQDEHPSELLYESSKQIQPGDKDNKEGIAARVFFDALYGDDFKRFGDSAISKALNYGYSILNSAMVRQLVFYGANTSLGIWHDANGNPFNLASDLIEPFRALVDYYVFWHMDELDNPLPKNIRKGLINLLNVEVFIDGKNYKVDDAMGITCKSFISCLKEQDHKLIKLPSLIEVNYDNW